MPSFVRGGKVRVQVPGLGRSPVWCTAGLHSGSDAVKALPSATRSCRWWESCRTSEICGVFAVFSYSLIRTVSRLELQPWFCLVLEAMLGQTLLFLNHLFLAVIFAESKLCCMETHTVCVLTWAIASYVKLEEFAFPVAFLIALVQIMEFFLLQQ